MVQSGKTNIEENEFNGLPQPNKDPWPQPAFAPSQEKGVVTWARCLSFIT